MNLKGFPHSDIPGSKLVCSSPGLIAAYRVLHRLLAPRHSPYALSSLTTSVFGLTRPSPVFGLQSPVDNRTLKPSSRACFVNSNLFSHCVRYPRNAVRALR
jgi:hypothetical protein